MSMGDRSWVRASAFTAVLFLLITLATSRGQVGGLFALVVLLATLVAVTAFYRLFPDRHFFTIVLTNFLAVYTCIFSFFIEVNFAPVTPWLVLAIFPLPIFTFLAGAWRNRTTIHKLLLQDHHREIHHWGKVFRWLLPAFLIGGLTFALPGHDFTPFEYDLLFLASMSAIAAIVFFVSDEVCSFLLETSLLFELFFVGMKRLVIPAFAFFSFYSLIVIVYACIYRIIDTLGGGGFIIGGELREITFTESLYFSIVTLSTVGYGDIVPVSNLIRVIISSQIVVGALLILFGFAEFVSYGRTKPQRRSKD